MLSVQWLLDHGYLVEADLGSDPNTCQAAVDMDGC